MYQYIFLCFYTSLGKKPIVNIFILLIHTPHCLSHFPFYIQCCCLLQISPIVRYTEAFSFFFSFCYLAVLKVLRKTHWEFFQRKSWQQKNCTHRSHQSEMTSHLSRPWRAAAWGGPQSSAGSQPSPAWMSPARRVDDISHFTPRVYFFPPRSDPPFFFFYKAHLLLKRARHQPPELWQAMVDPVSPPLLYDLRERDGGKESEREREEKRHQGDGKNKKTHTNFLSL